jgi:hypothetical protein
MAAMSSPTTLALATLAAATAAITVYLRYRQRHDVQRLDRRITGHSQAVRLMFGESPQRIRSEQQTQRRRARLGHSLPVVGGMLAVVAVAVTTHVLSRPDPTPRAAVPEFDTPAISEQLTTRARPDRPASNRQPADGVEHEALVDQVGQKTSTTPTATTTAATTSVPVQTTDPADSTSTTAAAATPSQNRTVPATTGGPEPSEPRLDPPQHDKGNSPSPDGGRPDEVELPDQAQKPDKDSAGGNQPEQSAGGDEQWLSLRSLAATVTELVDTLV